MKPKILLRSASVVMLIHCIGHTMGHSTWKQPTDPVQQEIVKQMTTHPFPFMGAVHTIGEYYNGYGFAATLALLLISAILWIVSGVKTGDVPMVKKILVVMTILLLGWGINELIFFFPFAAAFSLLSMFLCIIAIFNLKKIPS